MKRSNFGKTAFFALMVTMTVFAFQADAQRKRPRPTPTPVLTGAEIISRAGDQADPQTTVQTPDKQQVQLDPTAAKVKDLNSRVKKLEASQPDSFEQKQKRVLMNLDILTRAEQRSESLRKQLFEMMEKESSVKSKLDQIENDIRPEVIERALQLAGSFHPEEIREARRKVLEAERKNQQDLLLSIQQTRATLAANLEKADILVERLRAKLEKEIDDSFLKDEPQN